MRCEFFYCSHRCRSQTVLIEACIVYAGYGTHEDSRVVGVMVLTLACHKQCLLSFAAALLDVLPYIICPWLSGWDLFCQKNVSQLGFDSIDLTGKRDWVYRCLRPLGCGKLMYFAEDYHLQLLLLNHASLSGMAVFCRSDNTNSQPNIQQIMFCEICIPAKSKISI